MLSLILMRDLCVEEFSSSLLESGTTRNTVGTGEYRVALGLLSLVDSSEWPDSLH